MFYLYFYSELKLHIFGLIKKNNSTYISIYFNIYINLKFSFPW